MKPKIHFLSATTPKQKISLLTETAHKLFCEGKRIQIQAPSDEALRFLDDLLWSYKEESFLPHTIASSPTSEPIVLTKLAVNLNNADVLIHLLPTLPPLHFPEIYDLLDETTPEKKEAAEHKRARLA